jgi:hypothetical protein
MLDIVPIPSAPDGPLHGDQGRKDNAASGSPPQTGGTGNFKEFWGQGLACRNHSVAARDRRSYPRQGDESAFGSPLPFRGPATQPPPCTIRPVRSLRAFSLMKPSASAWS